MLMQQRAIFEMGLGDDGVPRAHELLQEARRLAPWNLSIDHSLAELALRKSELANAPFEQRKYREEARTIGIRLIAKNPVTAHPYHTLLKLGLLELEEVLKAMDSATSDRKIRELEGVVAKALQAFPDDQFLLEADARFNTLINNYPEALASLEQAFFKNKRSPYIAQRLANTYTARGDMTAAIRILRECLEHTPNEKEISYRLARLLMPLPEANPAEIKHLLRNSFTKGDARHGAQFWYARLLYLEGNINEAQEMFATLHEMNADAKTKREPRGKVEINGMRARFNGILSKKELSYAFIRRDGLNDSIFARREDNGSSWSNLGTHRRVSFELWFNYRGPIAKNMTPES
jgi:tetratricopeptide (TPR) repeat protein